MLFSVSCLNRTIAYKQRRYQKLKEQEAAYGLSVDPKVSIEIEDIEKQIGILTALLEETTEQDEPLFTELDTSNENMANYQELKRVLDVIKAKEAEVYSLSFELEFQASDKFDEYIDFKERRLKSLLDSIHAHISYTLEKLLDAPSLLIDYKHRYEAYSEDLTALDLIPCLSLCYPRVMECMSPYIDVMSSILPYKQGTENNNQNGTALQGNID